MKGSQNENGRAIFLPLSALTWPCTDRGEVLFYRPGSLVEFAARGEDVELLWNNGNRVKASGSSYAAPVASAILARLISIYPGLSPLAAKELLRLTAEPWSQSVAARREQRRSLV